MAEGLRVALLGCGRIARLVHLPVLARLAGVTVVALADPDAPALAAAGALAPGATAHSEWADALRQPGLDAAVVTLPPALHAPASLAALGAGLHLYLEKPLAMTLAEGEAILAAAQASGRTAQIGFNFRHNAGYRDLGDRLRAGVIGDAILVRTLFTSAARALPAWKQSRDAGGGVIRDLGVHHLDLVEHLLGEPLVALSAIERSVAAEADVAQILGRTRSGVPVSISVSLASGDSVNRVEIVGTRGHLLSDTADAAPRAVETPASRGRPARVKAALAGLLPRALLHQPGAEGSFPAALGAFVAAAAAGAAADPGLAAGHRALQLVLAAEEAAASGGTVIVPEPMAAA
jgi:predicted dehydrogenase